MVGRAALNPLNYSAAVRALFRALDRWVAEDVAPPPSAYPHIADGTLTSPDNAGWPAFRLRLPQQPLRAFHLNFGPDWSKGIVSVEPPEIGAPFVVRVPAVDADGNVRPGIRLPDIAVPRRRTRGGTTATRRLAHPIDLAGEIGSYIPFARTRRRPRARPRSAASIEERYRNRDEYVGKFATARSRPRRTRLSVAGRRRGSPSPRYGALRLGDEGVAAAVIWHTLSSSSRDRHGDTETRDVHRQGRPDDRATAADVVGPRDRNEQ